ncbi:MAG: hypothetical protein RI554_01165, partial [Trueperaceae bacterium]|nr:hypothetical protein [Trueperaceae bacterium]
GARVLVLLPDMPGVEAAHLAALRRAARAGGGAASRYPGGAVGAPALLPASLAAALAAEADVAQDRGVAPALAAGVEAGDVAVVPLTDAGDVDTPDAARARGWTPGGSGTAVRAAHRGVRGA